MEKYIKDLDTAAKFMAKLVKDSKTAHHEAVQIKNDYDGLVIAVDKKQKELDAIKLECHRQIKAAEESVAVIKQRANRELTEANKLKAEAVRTLEDAKKKAAFYVDKARMEAVQA